MTEQQRRDIIVETVKAFRAKQWFRDVTIYDSHPNTGEPTMEIKVNYVPLFERKEVKEFVLRFGLVERYLVVDRNGNPTE